MAATIADADVYIDANVIMAEDWLDADTAQKQRILSTAQRIFAEKFPGYTIPDNAVYEFCAVLAVNFNDTNRLFQQGLAGFSITGVGSWTDKQGARKDIYDMIPRTAVELINAEPKNADLPRLGTGRAVKWTVL